MVFCFDVGLYCRGQTLVEMVIVRSNIAMEEAMMLKIVRPIHGRWLLKELG